MTDKDKMIEEMAHKTRKFTTLGYITKERRNEFAYNLSIELFNAGIRPKEGFELDMSETKQELFEEDISIKPKQFEEEQ